jgi:arylsulfatase A-like enzyme
MGRKILFITTDQMRYDALGCNGGQVALHPGHRQFGGIRHQLPACPQPKCDLYAGREPPS